MDVARHADVGLGPKAQSVYLPLTPQVDWMFVMDHLSQVKAVVTEERLHLQNLYWIQ